MAGHSKWANTKYRKSMQDSKRGKIFTKIIREVVTAARIGGGDPASNARLRAVIDKALFNNIARNTLNRAITRGVGGEGIVNMETITYEGYGPGGVAMIIECLSDNRNRTVAAVRHAFSKFGGNLSTNGSVIHLFNRKGILSFKKKDENTVIIAALEAGAEDIISCDNNVVNVYTAWEKMHLVRNALEVAGLKPDHSEISMIPSEKIDINIENMSKLLRLVNMLEYCDDVQEVHHNGKFSDKIITKK